MMPKYDEGKIREIAIDLLQAVFRHLEVDEGLREKIISLSSAPDIVERFIKLAADTARELVRPETDKGYLSSAYLSEENGLMAIELIEEWGGRVIRPGDVCEWRQCMETGGWSSGCSVQYGGWDSPPSDSWKHCPFCGKPIKEIG